jgi:hypothetical protein
MPKGERILAQSKRTAPPPNFKMFSIGNFKLVPYYVQKEEKSSISKLIHQNPLEH